MDCSTQDLLSLHPGLEQIWCRVMVITILLKAILCQLVAWPWIEWPTNADAMLTGPPRTCVRVHKFVIIVNAPHRSSTCIKLQIIVVWWSTPSGSKNIRKCDLNNFESILKIRLTTSKLRFTSLTITSLQGAIERMRLRLQRRRARFRWWRWAF